MPLLSQTVPLGQSRQREMMKDANTLVYGDTSEGPLHAHFFVPANFEAGQRRTSLIFLHGGFWDHPMPTQFVPQCLHFATRGAIAATVETRVSSIHGTGPIEAAEDVRRFFEWQMAHGDGLGLDPARVILVGASGGAWLALQHLLSKPPGPVRPAALVLFSALLDTNRKDLVARFSSPSRARKLSPLRQVRRKLPPILLCHGKRDRVTPFDDARRFARALRWRQNEVELLDFERAEHAFFNFNVSEFYYELTLRAADRFLVDHGLLEPEEAVD